MKRTILIDCDPGIDDAIAILLGFASPELDIVGISCVGGNVGADITTTNALALVNLVEKNVPVARGIDNALFIESKRAPLVHGKNGLGDYKIEQPKNSEVEKPAFEFIRDMAKKYKGQLELVAIGPLTNIAMTITSFPEVKSLIKGIHIMGGSAGLGNATPAAEFNIYADPHAAAAVFQSGVPITMCGLDVTSQALMTNTQLENLRALGGKITNAACSMMDFYMKAYKKLGRDGMCLHDPLVIANLADPSLVQFKKYHVDIETVGQYTKGKTVVDVYGVSKKALNAEVGVSMNNDAFIEMLCQRIHSLDK